MKLLNKCAGMSVQLKSSFWYTVSQIFQKGIGFIIVPLYTRILSSQEYGRYNIFYSWYEVMIVFGTLRIYANSFNVGLAKYENDRDRYTSSMVGLGGVCSLCFFGVLCLFHVSFEKWLEMSFPFILLLFVEIFWNPSLNLWSQRQRYDYHYKALNAVTMISTAMTPVIGFILIAILPNKALGAILGKSLPQIMAGVLCAFLILRKDRTLYNRAYWTYALQFNLPLIFYYLAQVLLNQMDRIMIQKMGTVSQVGIYSVANAAAHTLSIVSSAINVSFIPYMFQKMKAHKEGQIRNLANVLVVLVAVCNMCLVMLAPEAMKLMAPSEYQDGIWLIPPLVTNTFIAFVYQMYCNVEFYYEKKFFLMWASIGVCVCNFILNYIFIGKLGYVAAGYTTMISSMICFGAHYFCVKRILKKEKGEEVFSNRFILMVCILFTLFSGAMMLVYDYVVIRYILIIVAGSVVFMKRRLILQKVGELKAVKSD